MTDDDKIIPPEVWNDPQRREALLARRPRVRRERRLSQHLEEELKAGQKYPFRLDGMLPGYEVVYRRGRWRKLETPQIDEPDFRGFDRSVRVRHAFCWIRMQGRDVGAVSFREIDAEGVAPPDFSIAMDNESQELSRWAAVLLDEWEDINIGVFDYGPILELHEVWVEPGHSSGGIWKPVVEALLERLFAACSVMVAHAFPLEYGGRVPDGAATAEAFERRHAAMMRVAARELGLRPMPGPPGEEGFVWRVRPGLEKLVRPPSYGERWKHDI